MQIQGSAYIHGPQSISAPHVARGAALEPFRPSRLGADELTISDHAQFVDLARQLPDTRQDRVASLRAQIASGNYETPARLDTALSRLLDEIG